MLNTVDSLPDGFHKAIHEGNFEYVKGFINYLKDDGDKNLLQEGLNDKIEGQPPLHVFAWYKSYDSANLHIAKLLIDNGANVNAIDPKGNTALHTCVATFIHLDKGMLTSEYRESTEECLKGYKPFMGLLINSGCNAKLKNHAGETALENLHKYLAVCGDKTSNYLIANNLVKPVNFGPYTGEKIDENSLKAAYNQYVQSQNTHVAYVNDNPPPKQSKCTVM